MSFQIQLRKEKQPISPLVQGPYYRLIYRLFHNYLTSALPNETVSIHNDQQLTMYYVYLTTVEELTDDLIQYGIHSAKDLQMALKNVNQGVYDA